MKVGTCTLNTMHMHTYFHIVYTHIHTSHIQYKKQRTHGKVAYACGTCPFALVSLQVAKKFRFAFGPISFSRSIASLRKKYRGVACCIVSILSPKSKQ